MILTAGPWIAKLLPPEYAAHFRVYRQTLCWFALQQNFERYTPERFPVFIWITGNRMQDMLYGFPAIDGLQRGLKVATERYENTVDPDAVPRDVSEESIAEMYSEYIAPRFPDVGSQCLRTATCLYTVTPDAKFVIDYADAEPKHPVRLGVFRPRLQALARRGRGPRPARAGSARNLDLSAFRLGIVLGRRRASTSQNIFSRSCLCGVLSDS